MPKCFDCKQENETLYSIDRPTADISLKGMGQALCKECANKELKKQKRPLLRSN